MTLNNANPPLFVASGADETLANFCYAVADTRLHTTRALRYLAHHRLERPPAAIPDCPHAMQFADPPTAVHATGWLAGLDRQVEAGTPQPAHGCWCRIWPVSTCTGIRA